MLIASAVPGLAASADAAVDWQPWDDTVFERAQAQNKLVFLYLEAVWCHWCHVMGQTTLQDSAVLDLLDAHFLPVKVDHDAHPALADRYRAWGWPANIFLDAQGRDLVRRAGYLSPEGFARLLQALIDDPTPERDLRSPPTPAAQAESQLDDVTRVELVQRHIGMHDAQRGGLRGAHKYLDRAHVEWAMQQAQRGDDAAARRARKTLDAARALLDPAWGGVYQYSTGGRWDRPHFEKLLRIQAAYLRIYALAHAQWPEAGYDAVARGILRYSRDFLRAEDGSYRNSQDADLRPGQKAADYFALSDAARRARGIPRVDPNAYLLGNAEMASALAHWHAASGDVAAREDALTVGRWLRSQASGHLLPREQGLFLSDQLAVAHAWMMLYRISADRSWLASARATAQAAGAHFAQPGGGFLPQEPAAAILPPQPALEDNVRAARLFNLLAHYTGDAQLRARAEHALRYLVQPAVALARVEESGILLAADELARDPVHLAVVGPKQDPMAQSLFAQAQRIPGADLRLEWWDRSEGPLPHDDVPYPQFERAAGYVCANQRCSRPAFSATEFAQSVKHVLQVTMQTAGTASTSRGGDF